MKLISFSLYGNVDMYMAGAIENCRLARTVYPGWHVVVYVDQACPAAALMAEGATVRRMRNSQEHSGMLWRFLPAWEKCVKRVIFRDCDSRLNVREAAAVAAWERSGLRAHSMHDHAHHRPKHLPLFGGMWGVVGGVLDRRSLRALERLLTVPVPRVGDMHYLARYIEPQVRGSMLRHASLPVPWPGAVPFPPHAEYDGFVGQQYGADGVGISP